MWVTNVRPEDQGETIIIHIGDDVVLKLSRRASAVRVAIDAPGEKVIKRADSTRNPAFRYRGSMGVDD